MKLDDRKIKTILKSLPKRGDLLNPKCPAREVVDSLTGLWGLLILRALSENEVLRNAELKRLVPGISEKMLAQTLRRLERVGFIKRMSYPEIPPRVEYCLSDIGRGSSKMLVGFCDYIEENLKPIAHQMLVYDQTDHSKPWQKPRR
jgi:DNA-binding HxlR family transcriptional regulator